MLSGSCLCTNNRISIQVNCEPKVVSICYCKICRKLSGNLGTIGTAVPEERVTISDPAGKMRYWTNNNTDSGMPSTLYFCGDCSVKFGAKAEVFRAKYGKDMFAVSTTVLDDTERWQQFKPTMAHHEHDNIGWYHDIAQL